jgi:LPS-assembly protein
MMLRYFVFVLIFVSIIQASTSDMKLFAKNFFTKDGAIVANGDINFSNKSYKILADKVNYDNNMTNLEFFGNVKIFDKSEDLSLSATYIKTILQKDYIYFEDFMLINKKQKIWLKSKCSHKEAYIFSLKNTIISACEDKENPFWKIEFSDGGYDYQKESLSLTNVVFYIKSFPIAFSPYLTLQLGSTPKSGLLIPSLSLFGDQAYMQPIFFSIKKNIDFQTTPYIRLNNGIGAYNTLRFMSSSHSQGRLTFGLFNKFQNSKYQQNDFYGYEFDYKNTISDTQEKQEIFATSIKNFNDIAYINFKTLNTLDLKVDTLFNSRMIYVYQNNDWVVSTQIKDVKDIKTKLSIQLLPILSINKTKNYIFDNLLYKFDYKLRYLNKNISESLNPLYQEMSIPVEYYVSLFDDYVDIKIKDEIQITNQEFYRKSSLQNSATAFQNNISFSLSSKLAKVYDKYIHSMDMYLSFNKLTYRYVNEPYVLPEPQEDKISINVNQYIINNENTVFSHRLRQDIYKNNKTLLFDDIRDINSYLEYEHDNFSIYNKSNYSIVKNKLSYSSTNISFHKGKTKMNVSYLYENNKNYNGITNSKYFGTYFDMKVSKNLNVGFDISFDINIQEYKKAVVQLEYDKGCWGYILKFGKNDIPNANNIQRSDLENNNILYFQIKFNPIGGLSHNYHF